MSDLSMTRIGIALSKREGTTRRRKEYGIWIFDKCPDAKYVRYEGYREDRGVEGEVSVELPLASSDASWRMPLNPLRESDFETVTYLRGEENGDADR